MINHMAVIAPHELEHILEGLSTSTKPNTRNSGMGNNARDRFSKMNMALFMSREAERSIREREAPAKQSGKKQIF